MVWHADEVINRGPGDLMYSTRWSDVGWKIYGAFVGVTVGLLVITWMIVHMWHVEVAGRWTTGQVVSKAHCTDFHNTVLSTVILTVSFTDNQGTHRTSQTDCQYDTVGLGQSVAIRYVPGDPGYILTHQDIAGGQGPVLVVVVVVDALCVTLVSVIAVRGLREHRRGNSRAGQPTWRSRPGALADG